MDTVTVIRQGATVATRRYRLEFSKLAGQSFGPYGFVDAIEQLKFAAGLDPVEARNLVCDAAVGGTGRAEVK
jgi:hypothetical protein